MTYDLEKYSNFVCSILRKIPCIKTDILLLCLKNCFSELDAYEAKNILFELQSNGDCLLSQDGWAITKGTYYQISNDTFRDNISYFNDYRLPNIEHLLSSIDKDDVDVMWIVADMMPLSKDFIVCDIPWNIMFDTYTKDSSGKLVQIIKIPSDIEDLRIELLKCSKNIIPDESVRDSIKRIALIENKEHSWKIPHLGFTDICILDSENPRGFRVVERRTEGVWRDIG